MDPHASAQVFSAGTPLETAQKVLILLHGRGGSARDILNLGREIAPPHTALLAVQAVGSSWYPFSFLVPLEQNQPFLSSALHLLAGLIGSLEQHGVLSSSIFLAGFSQGACLALEFAARCPRQYGGVMAFTGGLIGAELKGYEGDLLKTPIFIGTSDVDAHVPLERVNASAHILERMNARVTVKVYPDMLHTINQDELEVARGLVSA